MRSTSMTASTLWPAPNHIPWEDGPACFKPIITFQEDMSVASQQAKHYLHYIDMDYY